MASGSEQIMRLDGKVALVTGAGRGLGAEIASVLAGAGAAVMVTDVNENAARETAQKINDTGGKAESAGQDVTVEAQWEGVMAKIIESLGGLHILINNAGIETMATFADCELQDFQNVQNINVNGSFLGIKHAIRAMRPEGACGQGGAIVNLSSVAGIGGYPGLGAYCASKGAARLMTKAAAVECAAFEYGIRVNSIHPGLIKTEMGNSVLKGFVRIGLAEDEAAADALLLAMQPLGFGQPDDVANAALFLASDAAKWITGTELGVDGGARA